MAKVGESTPVFKLLILGDAGVGKTSVIHRQLSSRHPPKDPRDESAVHVYFRGALGAFIVYDISRPQTFDSAVKWKRELDSSVTLPNGNPLPVVLLGNKVDLETASVDVAYVDSFVRKHDFIAWSDISAKDESDLDFDGSMTRLIEKILCCEELFGPEMRRSASERNDGKPSGIKLDLREVRAAATSSKGSNGCCG